METTRRRSFCYVDDLVDGAMLMTLAEITGPIDLGNSKKFARLYSTEDKVDALLRLKRLKVGHWLTYSVTTHIGIARVPAGSVAK